MSFGLLLLYVLFSKKWLHLSWKNLKNKVAQKILVWTFFVSKHIKSHKSARVMNTTIPFKFEASLNSVHFPILAYITLSPQNDILSLFSATRLTEFINYLEEWWQKPKVDLEHQNRVPIVLCLLQDNVIYITYYTFCSVSMFKYNDDCM